MSILSIPTARVFTPLLAPARYKGLRGGRGSGKSHFFAEKLIDDSIVEPGENQGQGLNSVCIREIQKDLAQSSKLLIENKLSVFRLGEAQGFRIFRDVIQTPGDGIILFKGMNDYNGDSIKSLEGFKRSWWEEAQTASLTSLNLLTPTIRAPGSEKWFSWNPRRAIDPVDKLLRGDDIPTGAVIIESNWRDNPFFTDELEQERVDCLRLQPDQYDHIWEGAYVSIVAGSYWKAELTKCKADGRISVVAEDPLMTKRVFIDIGGTGAKSDAFSMWVVQFIGKEIRVLDHYTAQGQPLATHLAWLREKKYTDASIWLPHDGETNDRVYDVSFESAFKAAHYPVEVVTNQGKGAARSRIESVRRTFPNIWFNAETTEAGRDSLGWYHERKDEQRDIGLGPDHDWSSHDADAFGLMSIVYEKVGKQVKTVSDPYKAFRKTG